MGHIRLGDLPRTRLWEQVVALIGAGATAVQVSQAAILAAEKGLKAAAGDPALVETLWLLTQLPVDARSDNFVEALRHTGIHVSSNPSLMELIGAFSECVDRQLTTREGCTDLGEMAQMAAMEVIHSVVSSRVPSLYEANSEDVRDALAPLGTTKHFSSFAKQFFSRFCEKVLSYYVCRAYNVHTGEGRRFATTAEHAQFTAGLALHCKEASVIIEKFSGEWFSKTNWEKGGISKQEAAGFAHIAMRKICDELKKGAGANGK